MIPREARSDVRVVRHLSGRAGHPVARRRAAAELRGRLPRREPARSPGACTTPGSRSPPATRGASTPTSRPTSPPAPASSSKTTAGAASRRSLSAIRDAGGTLIYVLHTGAAEPARAPRARRRSSRTSTHLELPELIRPTLVTELSRSMTRARVQQYQRYFADADRVLILLHNDPDPDALASGLALRNLLRRTKTTAIIGAMQGVTRPENLRMANMLDIHVEQITPASFDEFERIATVDVQPHYFGGLLERADLVDRSPSRAARLQRGLQGHPRRLRLDVHDPDRAPARRRREHLGAHRDGDALRDQVGHAVLRAPHQSRRSRGVHVPLSARRRRADPQDGRGGNHARAARVRHPRRARAASCATRCSARSSAKRRARTSSPTPPTSSCSSKT